MSTMVVIRCPETDAEVSVGIQMDLHTFDLLPSEHVVLKCPACGNRHAWSRKDAYLSLARNAGPPEKR
jgi:hypothetical protein